MKIIKFLLIFFLAHFLIEQRIKAQTWEWAKGVNDADGMSTTTTWDVLVDSGGYIYSFASFYNPAFFGTCFLSPDWNGKYTGGLIKYDSNGNCIWFKKHVRGNIIGVGNKEKNIFLCLQYDEDTLNGCIVQDTGKYFAKYDLDGNCKYARTILSGNGGFYSSKAIDKNDNFYLTGSFTDTIQLDSITLIPSIGEWERFFTKFNKDGYVKWVKKVNVNINTGIYIIGIDDAGNIYGCGGFKDTITIDSYSAVCLNSTCPFTVKFDTNGTIVWLKQIQTGYLSYIMNNYIYSVIHFSSGFISDCDTGTGKGVVLSKYDTSGSCIWSKVYPEWWPEAITGDSLGNIILVGTGGGTDIFGCGVITESPFLVLLDSNGNCLNMAMASGSLWNSSVGMDKNNNVYLASTAWASPTTIFGSDTIFAVANPGYSTGFVAKLSGLITAPPPAKIQRKGLFIFPNPAQQKYTLVIPEELPLEGMFIRVFDSTGRLAMEEPANSHQQTLDLWGYEKGLYLVRVNVGAVDYVGRIVVE